MAGDILGQAFAWMPSGQDLATIFLWGMIFLFVGLIMSALMIFILVMKKSTKFIEINLVTRKVQQFNGRLKKIKGIENLKRMWIGKIKKYLPPHEQKDIYLGKGNKDTVILIKDKNGMHHTARLPTYKEIKKWYEVVYGIDIEEKIEIKDKEGNILETRPRHAEEMNKAFHVYLQPNPLEDLNWLADQIVEAKETFADVWWKHPNVMVIGIAAICAFMFIMTLIITHKM